MKGEGAGKIANAPPPDAFQFTLIYFCGTSVSGYVSVVDGTYCRCRDEVRVPGAAGHLHVLDPVLLLGVLAKDMATEPVSLYTWHLVSPRTDTWRRARIETWRTALRRCVLEVGGESRG